MEWFESQSSVLALRYSINKVIRILFPLYWFLILSKPLSSIRVFKTLRGRPKGKVQRGQYLLAVGLDYYKWYQSQVPSGVPTRTLGLKGGRIVRSHIHWRGGTSASENVGFRREVDCEISYWLERETSASEDVGPRKEVDCEISYRLERETKHCLYTFFSAFLNHLIISINSNVSEKLVMIVHYFVTVVTK